MEHSRLVTRKVLCAQDVCGERSVVGHQCPGVQPLLQPTRVEMSVSPRAVNDVEAECTDTWSHIKCAAVASSRGCFLDSSSLEIS
jgi:hypothetical protein